jgi:hypothetical protein
MATGRSVLIPTRRAGIAAAKAEIPSCFWPAGSRPSCDHAAINLLAQTVASRPILGGDRADAHPLRHRSLRLFLCTKAKPGRWPVTTQSDGSAKGCAAPWPLDPCPDCNIFALFGLTATFPPAECLTAPALCLPRAVRGGDDSRARQLSDPNEVFEREQNRQHRKSVPIRGPADDKAAAGGPIR